MLEPDIGKGRQIKELIIVILKFGEIEKEINAVLATFWFLLQHPSLTDSFSTLQQSRTTPVDSHRSFHTDNTSLLREVNKVPCTVEPSIPAFVEKCYSGTHRKVYNKCSIAKYFPATVTWSLELLG